MADERELHVAGNVIPAQWKVSTVLHRECIIRFTTEPDPEGTGAVIGPPPRLTVQADPHNSGRERQMVCQRRVFFRVFDHRQVMVVLSAVGLCIGPGHCQSLHGVLFQAILN